MALLGKRILLIIGGGIAAYKSLLVIRLLKQQGAHVRAILTKGGAEFVTPLSVAALTENKVYQDLFSLTDEAEMGHIRLSREADLILVCPATANLMARTAHGLADDLASTCLLASSAPILMAPSMNGFMWSNPATQANLATLKDRGIRFIGPEAGDLACGENDVGRLAEPEQIVEAVAHALSATHQPLKGKRAIVTAGPTREALDPVRYVSNHSSGKQGFAIASALSAAGAQVTLIAGPVNLPTPINVKRVNVTTARDMLAAATQALPADLAVCAAAVADWRVEASDQKVKKSKSGQPGFDWVENPDILKTLSQSDQRPRLVVGFAAETQDLAKNAKAKLDRKGCDWIVANDVSLGTTTFGGQDNQVSIFDKTGETPLPRMDKSEVAQALVKRMIEALL